jgi:hypothetical protein
MQRYSQTALAFPIQTISFQPMNGNLVQRTGISCTLTTTPRFVDTIFILFPYDNNHRTCYINPMLSELSLKMGGYGQIPDLTTTTFSPLFYELCTNAMNMNNDSQGFNKDVSRSLAMGHNNPDDDGIVKRDRHSNDITNFFMAIPVETDHTFQQGQTSNSSISCELKAKADDHHPFWDMTSNPLIGFLKDSVMAIQLREGGTPIISIDDYDISSPS